jgi:hypothetical protein
LIDDGNMSPVEQCGPMVERSQVLVCIKVSQVRTYAAHETPRDFRPVAWKMDSPFRGNDGEKWDDGKKTGRRL